MDSIVIKDHVGALTLSRSDYLEIFQRQHHLDDIKTFLSKQTIFRHWPMEKLDPTHLIVKYYRTGVLISDGSEVPRYIHVLKGGDAKILRKLKVTVAPSYQPSAAIKDSKSDS